MRLADINFALTVILHAIVPPIKQQVTSSGSGSTKNRHLSISESSVRSRLGRPKPSAPHDTLETVAFLGKIFLVRETNLFSFTKNDVVSLYRNYYRFVHCCYSGKTNQLNMKIQGSVLVKALNF